MLQVKFLAGFGLFVGSMVGVASIDESRVMTPEEMQSTVGGDVGSEYCWDNGSCDALAASCNAASTCTVTGNECGVERELAHAETCGSPYGNSYCDSASEEDIHVVCATEIKCLCEFAVGDAFVCSGDENFGTTPVEGIIRTDKLNCQYDEWEYEEE